MIKELKLKFPLFQTKFFDHEKLKKSLIDKINKSNHNDTNGINDSIEKFDWNIAKDIERDWVKELIQPIYSQLNVFAQKMGYKRLTIKQIWFQKYVKNSVHNWHVHGDNYTGVYYLKLPTDHKSCYTQFLYPDNLNKRFSLDANEGDILFFPSFLIHRAPHLQSSEDKIIISWNCEFVGLEEKYIQERENIEFLKLFR
tara:strand:- start:54 stop:647 length:594 start_codon:yes stop_codon:yes gene_type:complete